jgi:hypothetical protein
VVVRTSLREARYNIAVATLACTASCTDISPWTGLTDSNSVLAGLRRQHHISHTAAPSTTHLNAFVIRVSDTQLFADDAYVQQTAQQRAGLLEMQNALTDLYRNIRGCILLT